MKSQSQLLTDHSVFLANYLGCNIETGEGIIILTINMLDTIDDGNHYKSCFCVLRHIDSLTDEEMIEVARLKWDTPNMHIGMHIINSVGSECERLPSNIADYLRSIGILLPFRSYSVQEIIDMGWAKYKA